MTTYQEVTDADALEIVDAVSMFALAKIRILCAGVKQTLKLIDASP